MVKNQAQWHLDRTCSVSRIARNDTSLIIIILCACMDSDSTKWWIIQIPGIGTYIAD